ncbi:MAG: endonuclease NucS [Chloroflexota bacterium]|nr:endonuclease NucS [Chloroflexota bacterium]
MSDAKLFRLGQGSVEELKSSSVAVEKSLQTLIEQHLDTFLGVRCLASEYSTGKNHGGRIDTLGLDENGSPVIIEYKRALNQNVINQGLFYLDWLMDHQADFKWLVLNRIGKDAADGIDWSAPRLLCIAGDFTKYDEHATKQINRSIELIRYRRYADEFLLLGLVNATSSDAGAREPAKPSPNGGDPTSKKAADRTIEDRLNQAPPDVHDRYEALKDYLLALGDDVQMKPAKDYFAFRRLKNFACVEVHPQLKRISLYLKVDPDSVALEPGFTRDVRKIGHFGTGDLEVVVHTDEDMERAKPLILKSYAAS